MRRRRILAGEHQSDGVGLEDSCPAVSTLIDVCEQESGQLVDARAQCTIRVIREAVQAERLVDTAVRLTLDLARQDSKFLVRFDVFVDLAVDHRNIRDRVQLAGNFR